MQKIFIMLVIFIFFLFSSVPTTAGNIVFIDISGSMKRENININGLFKSLRKLPLEDLKIYVFSDKCKYISEFEKINYDIEAKTTKLDCIIEEEKKFNKSYIYIITDGYIKSNILNHLKKNKIKNYLCIYSLNKTKFLENLEKYKYPKIKVIYIDKDFNISQIKSKCEEK